jgi:uncharacterized protein (TIGR02301 family)
MSLRLLLPVLALVCATPAVAQTAEPRPRMTYEDHLVELGRVLGGSHYLRILCNGRGDQRWRDFMRGVLQREPASTGPVTAAFNEGYRQEEARFPVCDRGAQQTEAELRAEGLRLAQGLSVRNAGQDISQRPDESGQMNQPTTENR